MCAVISGFSFWQEVGIHKHLVSWRACLVRSHCRSIYLFFSPQPFECKLKAYLLSEHDMPPSRTRQSKSASFVSSSASLPSRGGRRLSVLSSGEMMHGSFSCVWFAAFDMTWIYVIPHASVSVVKGICLVFLFCVELWCCNFCFFCQDLNMSR